MINWFKRASLGGAIAMLSLISIAIASNPVFVSISNEEIEELIEKIKNAPEHDLKMKESKNSPVKILDAKVKEISKEDFEKLTNKNSEKEIIASVPKAKIQNTSNKTISEVWFFVRELSSKRGRGIIIRNLSVAPGETYSVLREQFVKTKPVVETDENGNLKEFTNPFVQSRSFWLSNFEKTQLEASIMGVTFEDGTHWSGKDSK